MKKRPSLSPRQLILCIAILSAFTALVLFLFNHKRDEKKFLGLTHDLFVAEMSANTLNMHYTLASPEDFGIYTYEPLLPGYLSGGPDASRSALDNTLTALSQIRPGKLSSTDAYTYELLTRQLQNSRDLNAFALYRTPLSPSSGMQSQLPILMAEYTFRNRRDVEDYLALLDQTDTYFASLLALEQEKAAAGLSMSTYSLRQVKVQCDNIITKEALNSGEHFLQTTFSERLSPLVEDNIITAAEADKYVALNNRLLRTVVQPAYEALADGLFLLEDSEGVEPLPTGLCTLPDGKEYYRRLLISQTGSYRSVEEIQALLQENIQSEYRAVCTLLQEHPELKEALKRESHLQLPLTDAESMLADLQTRMQTDFPQLPPSKTESADGTETLVATAPRVQIKEVSPSLQEYCAPAFYLTAPLDDTDNNVIYINHKNPPSGLELYTTLAHEGYPGHLYQTVYHNRTCLNHEENKVRQLLGYSGYVEGWALYVEFYGYSYAADLLREQDRAEDALCVELEMHNRSLILCLYSTLDIMIHYDNVSREEVAAYLQNFGIYSDTAANAVYNYIADEPCNYLKYYLGYLEILELKKTAESLWQTDYSDLAFHTFLLDAGPSDFTTLSDLLTKEPNRPMIF
ncbi:MAG: DUF885 domain-containing protein [Acetatifactor muris]|nr:DUF885 domain-containing protein [Acetatifactor muris]MCM1526635.1 DUF885 domain-containing protein [Bacteroides sp.]